MNVTVITGASDGIGAEMARQLAAARGKSVALVLAARSKDKLGLILQGMAGRQREVVMTARGKLARFVKLIAPGRVEDLALAALKDDVRLK